MNRKTLIWSTLISAILCILCCVALIILIFSVTKKPQVVNTYDSDLVEMSIDYKDGVYTVDIEKYNKCFSVNEKDTKIIVSYESKAIVEEYNNGLVKVYFYLGMD